MYWFLLYFSSRLTKELGMAPGGEFRRAFLEARNIPGCIIQLGDRPIEVRTLRSIYTEHDFRMYKIVQHSLD
jgi:pheromone shutdown protein TraB